MKFWITLAVIFGLLFNTDRIEGILSKVEGLSSFVGYGSVACIMALVIFLQIKKPPEDKPKQM